MDFETPEEAAKAIRERDHKVFHDKFGDRYVRLIQVRGRGRAAGAEPLAQGLLHGWQGVARTSGWGAPLLPALWGTCEQQRRPPRQQHPVCTHTPRCEPMLTCCPRCPSCQVSRKEMQATLSLRFGGEGILKVKGIPFKASAGDVRKFFSGFRIKPDGVSFIMHADGRPTGMAFIEFETPQEAVRAMVGGAFCYWKEGVWHFVYACVCLGGRAGGVLCLGEGQEACAPWFLGVQGILRAAVCGVAVGQRGSTAACLPTPTMQLPSYTLCRAANRHPIHIHRRRTAPSLALSMATASACCSWWGAMRWRR